LIPIARPAVGVIVLWAALASACAARVVPNLSAAPEPGAAAEPRPAAPSGAIRGLQQNLAQVFSAPIMARAVWAVDVRSLATGERLFELNAGKLMMPASNMKVVTLAAAAERLGWDHRFTTVLETASPVENGVLRGDLILRGSGDPTINSREDRARAIFDAWIGILRSAGIRKIDGRIVGDDQAFDDEGLGDGWSWDYLQYGYAAPVGALQYNENVARLTVAPGARVGDPAIVQLPPGTGLILVNRASTSGEEAREAIEYRRELFTPVLEISGSIPVGGEAVPRNVSVVNPTIYLAQAFRDALVHAGIPVAGEAVDLDDVAAEWTVVSDPRRCLGATESAPLREIATVLMKSSQNLYAETLVKALGASGGGIGTTAGGRQIMQDILTAWGVPPDAYAIFDGSGLSRYNYVSAGMIAAILQRMHQDPRHREEFAATLPIAGRDGTISTRMRRTLAEGNALAKTGSIANVRSLSGYVRSRDGEPLVFSIIANDFVIPAATVNWIADLAVEILAAFSREPF